jgi:hypothetical protein
MRERQSSIGESLRLDCAGFAAELACGLRNPRFRGAWAKVERISRNGMSAKPLTRNDAEKSFISPLNEIKRLSMAERNPVFRYAKRELRHWAPYGPWIASSLRSSQ